MCSSRAARTRLFRRRVASGLPVTGWTLRVGVGQRETAGHDGFDRWFLVASSPTLSTSSVRLPLPFPVCSAPIVFRLLCELLLHPDSSPSLFRPSLLLPLPSPTSPSPFTPARFFSFPLSHQALVLLCDSAVIPSLLLLPRIYTRPPGGLRADPQTASHPAHLSQDAFTKPPNHTAQDQI